MGLGLLVKYLQNQEKQTTPAPVAIKEEKKENKTTDKDKTILRSRNKKRKKYDTILNTNEE